jgi:hypothetical protein
LSRHLINPTPTLSLPLKGREIVMFLLLGKTEIAIFLPLRGREIVTFLLLRGKEMVMFLPFQGGG